MSTLVCMIGFRQSQASKRFYLSQNLWKSCYHLASILLDSKVDNATKVAAKNLWQNTLVCTEAMACSHEPSEEQKLEFR